MKASTMASTLARHSADLSRQDYQLAQKVDALSMEVAEQKALQSTSQEHQRELIRILKEWMLESDRRRAQRVIDRPIERPPMPQIQVPLTMEETSDVWGEKAGRGLSEETTPDEPIVHARPT